MDTITGALGAIAAISLIIIVHEFGHYWVARRCGIFVEQFSIGFGRAIFQRKLQTGTQFRIGWLPLGGYVKMRGDELNETHLSEDSYGNKPVWQRMLVVLAGPAINFILTIIIYCFLFVVGVPTVKPLIASVIPNTTAADANFKANDEITQVGQYDAHSWSRVVKLLLIHYQDQDPINITTYNHPTKRTIHHQVNLSQWVINTDNPDLFNSFGIETTTPTPTTTIEAVAPNSPAAAANIPIGSTITAINQTPIQHWEQVTNAIHAAESRPLSFTYQHRGANTTVTLTPTMLTQPDGSEKAIIGIHPKLSWPYDSFYIATLHPLTALKRAITETQLLIHLNAVMVGKLITGRFPVDALSGPIMIFSHASDSALLGFVPYLLFIAYISTAIGFLNLLPVPGLDGGHFLFQLIEVLRKGKPIPAYWQLQCLKIGFAALIILMLVVTRNDLHRFLNS